VTWSRWRHGLGFKGESGVGGARECDGQLLCRGAAGREQLMPKLIEKTQESDMLVYTCVNKCIVVLCLFATRVKTLHY